MTSRTGRRNFVFLFAGTGVSAALALAYTAYAGRLLGPEGSADLFAALFLMTGFATTLAPVNGTVTRFTSLYEAANERGKTRTLGVEVSRRVAGFGLAGLALSLVILVPLGELLRFQSPLLLLLTLFTVYLATLASVHRGILRGLQWFGLLSLNTAVEAFVRLAVGVAILQWLTTAGGALLAYVAGSATALALLPLHLRSIFRQKTESTVDGRAIRRFVAPMLLLALVAAGFANADVLLVKHYFPRSSAGLYGAVATLTGIIAVLLTPFRILLLPELTALYVQGGSLGRHLFRICGRFLLLLAPPMAIFLLWPRAILVLAFGESFGDGAILVPMLAAKVLLSSLATLVCQGYVSLGSFRFLGAYGACFILELAGVMLFHDSLETVVGIVVGTQGLTLAVLIALFAVSLRQRRDERQGAPQ